MKKIISIVCSLLIVVTMFSNVYKVAAEERVIDLETFIQELMDNGGTFDGKETTTVKWKTDASSKYLKRVQSGNYVAQYWIGTDDDFKSKVMDIRIIGTDFVYEPNGITGFRDSYESTSGKDWDADQVKNAEFQFLNDGDVYIENCTFDKIVVSPFGSNDGDRDNDANREFTIKNSVLKNVYKCYTLKDIYPATATIEGNTFENCSGAIYFEGGVVRNSISVINNKFINVDTNTPTDDENTRGIIQLSGSTIFDSNTKFTISGNEIVGNTIKDSADNAEKGLPVIRLISQSDVTISGWTAGEAFSIKADGDAVKLPHFAEEEMAVNGHKYTFKGWAAADDYQGPTVVVDALLESGNERTDKGMYYAVWQDEVFDEPNDDPIVPVRPSRPDHKEESCEERFGDDWHWSEEYGACVLKEYSIVIVDTSTK